MPSRNLHVGGRLGSLWPLLATSRARCSRTVVNQGRVRAADPINYTRANLGDLWPCPLIRWRRTL